jgi:hypothetical protein
MNLREIGWGCGLDASGSEWGPVVGSCGHDNELLDPIKCSEFLDWVSNCRLLQKDSAPWN